MHQRWLLVLYCYYRDGTAYRFLECLSALLLHVHSWDRHFTCGQEIIHLAASERLSDTSRFQSYVDWVEEQRQYG